MRTQTVNIGGQNVIIREMLIKDIKQNLLPKIEPAYNAIISGQVKDVVDNLGDQMQDIIPELAAVNLDECYPSEVESFIEAWINVNFTGLKRILKPLLSLLNKDFPTFGQG